MLHSDRDALICDMAETYGIYSLESLPIDTAAVLACGLRETSRIKMKLTGVNISPDILLLAHIADRAGLLVWKDTKDGRRNRNRPVSFVEMLTGKKNNQRNKISVTAFNSPEEFEKARQEIIEKARARNV